MADDAVVNASPLIYLTGAGQIGLLRLAATQVLVPEAVGEEVGRWGEDDPVARTLATTSWLKRVRNPEAHALIQAWDLGPGETAVLSLALATKSLAIVDDLAARRCAATLGIPVRGTLGLVLTAKRRGAIPAARPLLDEMREAGMYLSVALMNQALTLVGE